MRFEGLSGISSRFRELSQSTGQVAHVLLTHPPLTREMQASPLFARLACIRHAASVRPEPGSNSPKREIRLARFSCWHHLRCPNCVSSTNGVSRSKRFYSSTFCCSVFNVHSVALSRQLLYHNMLSTSLSTLFKKYFSEVKSSYVCAPCSSDLNNYNISFFKMQEFKKRNCNIYSFFESFHTIL